MDIGFFVGCIAPLRYPGIESATREVLGKLGVSIRDLDGASCCPAPGVTRSFDVKTWVTMAARNIALAERQGQDILTVCNGCFGSLFESAHMLGEDPDLLREVNGILEGLNMTVTPHGVEIRHFAEFLAKDVNENTIKRSFKRKLDLDVAVHYGCHFLKPSKIKQLDDPERPTMVDKLVELTGARSLEYKEKQMCCGAGGGVRARHPETALAMTKDKMDIIKESGADCIVDVCPFCHLQYDKGQKALGKEYDVPVLHLAQLYGLAMDIDPKLLGFDAHAVPVKLKI
ncbi:MAG: CoB--CoM heterodisulfide reductase subunit B [Candidatus Thermoplasmatota archaeon]|nr:CoB--CoM heterodisulfide reductase subunit B [Candidatus Thermoplasmatota archaeon]